MRMGIVKYLAVALFINSCYGRNAVDPLSDEFIDLINSKATSWKAGRNFPKETSMNYLRGLLGVKTAPEGFRSAPETKQNTPRNYDYPPSFDTRDKWPNCASIGEVTDQGPCGSDWAIATTGVMTDRTCIFSAGKVNFQFSAQDLMSCCENCGSCYGGFVPAAFQYWHRMGIVSGGGYNSSEGCSTYQVPPCAHHIDGDRPSCGETVETPPCRKECRKNYEVSYEEDLRFGVPVYDISDQEDIKFHLLNYGPVVATFYVYEDFFHYKTGVYRYVTGAYVGTHAVKIIGYSATNNYWTCVNSWNTDWGENGYFRIARGTNECDIESQAFSGFPRE